MKCFIGTLALLLLAVTVAVGQQYLPFPMAANPSPEADRNGAVPNSPAEVRQTLPPAMAYNQAGTVETVPSHRENLAIGSPFPGSASPSELTANPGQFNRPAVETPGSPFPSAAIPIH
jgi:hypothetical protein